MPWLSGQSEALARGRQNESGPLQPVENLVVFAALVLTHPPSTSRGEATALACVRISGREWLILRLTPWHPGFARWRS